MSKFKPGLRVVVIDGDTHEIRKGVIKATCEEIETAIVVFDDGNVGKVGFDYLGIELETKAQEEKPTEPVENKILPDDNAEITITYGKFRDLCVAIAMKMASNPIDMFKFSAYGANLASRLFPAKEND